MDFIRELISNMLERQEILDKIELQCFNTLVKIKGILENNALNDADCFLRIEEIICALEEIGFDGGSRHDFG